MAASQNQHTQKIVSLLNAGQLGAAAKAARAAMKAFPKDPQFPNLAATIAAQGGDPRAAVPLFVKALKMRPGDEGFQENLIQALIESDQHVKARDLISKLIDKRPSSDRLWQLLAVSHTRLGEHEKAIEACDKALDINENNALAYNLRGISRRGLGDNVNALNDFEIAHRLTPRDPDPLANMIAPLNELFRQEEAIEAVEKALAINPEHRAALHGYAVLLMERGDTSEAIDVYRKLLHVDPLHAEGFSELVQSQSQIDNEPYEPAIRAAIAKTPKKSPSQVHLNLALGNLLFQKGDFRKAAPLLASSNAQEFQSRDYNADIARASFEQAKQLFPRGTPLPQGGDTKEPRPIFVLGQPRSGTTLTEMIVSAHPSVASFGELPTAHKLAAEIITNGADFAPTEFAQAYRGETLPIPAGVSHFVDKLPSNYLHVGFLTAAFPKAPIIHVERDPRDVALSMWRTYFPAKELGYTFNLEAMARTANLYREYMNHWKQVAGDRILTVDYAEIVSDIEPVSKKIAEFCGIGWTEDMMFPQKNKARVKTASVVQVREGVHKKSVGGWRRMEEALRPFNKALDRDLWPELEW